MELRQVEYVVGVVDHGGFGRAAAALHVSQPSLSQGVARLEAELGLALFDRLGRRVRPTAAGEAFLTPARRLLREARTAREAVAAVAGVRAGTLDLVALPTLAADPVAPLVGGFRRAYPEVTVRVAEPERADDVVARVRDGRCELGLTELPVEAPDLVTEHLLDDELLVVLPPAADAVDGALDARHLDAVPLVTTPPGTSTRRLVDRVLRAAGVEPRVVVETDQREALVPLVLAGAGASFVPRPGADRAAAAGARVAPLRPPLRRAIGLIRRRDASSPAAAAFVELARRGPS
jgi:LysR family transcriptional regulator, carnitine catabolism transcriptional activator